MLAALVDIDQRRMATPSSLHVIIETIVGQIGLPADKPAKGWKLPFKDAIPGAEPVQRGGGAGPEVVGVLLCLPAPAVDHGVDQMACTHGSPLLIGLSCGTISPWYPSPLAGKVSGGEPWRRPAFCTPTPSPSKGGEQRPWALRST